MACTPHRAELLAELAGGRLDGEALDELLDHVEGCATCSAELDLAADLVARRARAVPSAVPSAVPRGLDPGSMRWPLAAAALFLAVLGLGWLRGETDPRELARLAPLPAPTAVLRGPETPAEAWEAAIARYRAGELAAAANAFDALRAAGDDRALVDLYLGISAAGAGELERAAAALDRATAGGEGLVRDRARWYRAQVHLAAGEARAAIDLLRAIVRDDRDYAPNAAAQLRELGEE